MRSAVDCETVSRDAYFDLVAVEVVFAAGVFLALFEAAGGAKRGL